MSTGHPTRLPPYFESVEQQREANNLGMWIFLVTEIMLFGGIFLAYTVYFFNYPAAFAEASRELDLILSSVNTVILLCSSLTVALGVYAAQTDRKRALVFFLILTLILGTLFLGLKGVEYAEKFEKNLLPGPAFEFKGAFAQQAELFFGLYFVTTGLHAVHMIGGLLVLLYITFKAWRKQFSSLNHDLVEMFGLYWHFVDIAWVFIFPLFYLIERH